MMSDFGHVLNLMDAIHQSKNHDYGDSFSKSYREFGLIAAVVRMSDKMERLKTLCKKDAMVGESVRDTLIDLACYAAMTVAEIDAANTTTTTINDILDKI